jgi:hypothetical protein
MADHGTATRVILLGLAAAFLLWKTYLIADAVATRALTIAQMQLNVAMMLNPIALIIVAIVALGVAFYVLLRKSDRVKNWFKQNWPLLLAILTGPFGLAALFVIRKWDSIVGFVKKLPGRMKSAGAGLFDWVKDEFKRPINWVIGKWNALEFTIGGQKVFGKKLPSTTIGTPNIPLLGRGGTVAAGGTAIVGELGTPELLTVHQGEATVTPLADDRGAILRIQAEAPVRLVVDGKVLGETYIRWLGGKLARA